MTEQEQQRALNDWLEMQEMIEGYNDGFADHRDDFPAETNRSEMYRHGWLNGRDDRVGKPRAAASELRAIADNLLAQARHQGARHDPA